MWLRGPFYADKIAHECTRTHTKTHTHTGTHVRTLACTHAYTRTHTHTYTHTHTHIHTNIDKTNQRADQSTGDDKYSAGDRQRVTWSKLLGALYPVWRPFQRYSDDLRSRGDLSTGDDQQLDTSTFHPYVCGTRSRLWALFWSNKEWNRFDQIRNRE